MKTIQCKCEIEIHYNYHYQCYQCTCGACYNALGNELAPLSVWKDEYDEE